MARDKIPDLMYSRLHLTTLFISKLSSATRNLLSENGATKRLQSATSPAMKDIPLHCATLGNTLSTNQQPYDSHSPDTTPGHCIAGDGTGDGRVAAPQVNSIE
ncbi:hypothetical protein HYFRA_00011671 [Hymenoscyphus fraxineus]|uniref:Uncharacterized protein n=1 Tax=Hymenoscyphus fraxineus TaxID=746836 RepID=A0A9N9L1E2_9HELO|nr:hypothetical protein HYFRA_00011671 [Hymenoscyphus fraxineus]